MKVTGMMAIGLGLSLVGTGCATKKYVAKTVAPVEQRVGGTETKNAEQDKTISAQSTQIEGLDRDLSRTKEKLNDTDAKAAQAGDAAKMADQHAGAAQQAADGAKQSADGAKMFAEQGINKLGDTVNSMNKFQMAKSESVLFGFNQDTLTPDAKMQLDDLGNQAKGMNRYAIEVQGYTDKSGSATYNEMLSERRAEAVARYLANQYQIPVRTMSVLGSGYAAPVADDGSRDGRKMNRRVEVRLWVPESESAKTTASSGGGSQ
jgi:outer membrane protein OmpA-like peptidoglycan-associated protein